MPKRPARMSRGGPPTGLTFRRAGNRRLAPSIRDKHGRIDAVINSAAVLDRRPLASMSLEHIAESIDINFTGAVNVAWSSFPHLSESRGHLMLFASSSYTYGRALYSTYSASKAAVVNLTQALADEWSPAGVKVNCVNPSAPAPDAGQGVRQRAAGNAARSRGVAWKALESSPARRRESSTTSSRADSVRPATRKATTFGGCSWRKLQIAVEVTDLCDRHGIRYALLGGSALGARRHRGFIPWDDDMDMGMLRDDFERFLDVARRELSDSLYVQYWRDDPHMGATFAKVRRNNTVMLEEGSKDTGGHKGISIDIFPFDNVPDGLAASILEGRAAVGSACSGIRGLYDQ